MIYNTVKNLQFELIKIIINNMSEAFLRDSILDLKDLHNIEEEELTKKERIKKQLTKKKKI